MDGHAGKHLLGTAEDGGEAVRCISSHPHSEQNQDQIQREYLKAENNNADISIHAVEYYIY